jgi:hypothetical protein
MGKAKQQQDFGQIPVGGKTGDHGFPRMNGASLRMGGPIRSDPRKLLEQPQFTTGALKGAKSALGVAGLAATPL